MVIIVRNDDIGYIFDMLLGIFRTKGYARRLYKLDIVEMIAYGKQVFPVYAHGLADGESACTLIDP